MCKTVLRDGATFCGMAVPLKMRSAPTVDGNGRCGSTAGYFAHRDRGEHACVSCKDALRRKQSNYRSVNGRDHAYEGRRDYHRKVSTPEGKARQRLREKERRQMILRQSVSGCVVSGEGKKLRSAYYGDRCYLCGVGLTVGTWTMDHVIPLSRGGLHLLSNMRPCCRSCNSQKGNA